MNCSYCGAALEERDKNCPSCGAPNENYRPEEETREAPEQPQTSSFDEMFQQMNEMSQQMQDLFQNNTMPQQGQTVVHTVTRIERTVQPSDTAQRQNQSRDSHIRPNPQPSQSSAQRPSQTRTVGEYGARKPSKGKSILFAVIIFIVLIGVFTMCSSSSEDGALDDAKKAAEEMNLAWTNQEEMLNLYYLLEDSGIYDLQDITRLDQLSTEDIAVYTAVTPETQQGELLFYVKGETIGGVTYLGQPLYQNGQTVNTISSVKEQLG